MGRINIEDFGLIMILSLVAVTIISMLFTSVFDLPTVKTGTAFILLFVAVYLIMIFTTVRDKKFDKTDGIMLFLVAASLIGLFFVLKNFLPEIFSSFPSSTQNMFSAIGIK